MRAEVGHELRRHRRLSNHAREELDVVVFGYHVVIHSVLSAVDQPCIL